MRTLFRKLLLGSPGRPADAEEAEVADDVGRVFAVGGDREPEDVVFHVEALRGHELTGDSKGRARRGATEDGDAPSAKARWDLARQGRRVLGSVGDLRAEDEIRGLGGRRVVRVQRGRRRREAVEAAAWVGKGGFTVTSTVEFSDEIMSRKVPTLRELRER